MRKTYQNATHKKIDQQPALFMLYISSAEYTMHTILSLSDNKLTIVFVCTRKLSLYIGGKAAI